ncbi:hypothetical protein MASR2M15_17650 [Anaerolineales bacterium]
MSQPILPSEDPHLNEGSADEHELEDPHNPLRTVTVPAIITHLDRKPHKAETGIVNIVSASHEAKNQLDEQDIANENSIKTMPKQIKPVEDIQVLVIEDLVEHIEIIQATLENLGMTVHNEMRGEKGLDTFRTLRPDLVFLDIGLPDMQGWRVLELLKAELDEDSIPPIVIITQYDDPANRLVGKLQGVHTYLVKPIVPSKVESIAKRALGLSKV